MALFKRAYAHGSMKALIDTGAVKVASEELAAQLANQASESLPEEPVGEVAPDDTAELAANLVQLSNTLQESADNAAQAAQAATGTAGAGAGADLGGAMGGAGEEMKAAAWKKAAQHFLQKLGQGTTITGDRPEQQNTAAQDVTGEGEMDQAQRPEGYANVGEDGVGTQEAAGQGALGDEAKVEGVGMGPAQEGSNTVTEVVNKSASIRNLIKAATQKRADSTVGVGSTPPEAVTGEGKLDDQNRPGGAGYANVGEDGVGGTAMRVPAGARIGEEKAHPGQEGHAGSENTVIQETKVGEDESYMQQFRLLGTKFANRLPFYFDSQQKVASIQYLMGLPPGEREAVVSRMEKTAEMPEGLKNYLADKGEGDKGKGADEESTGHEKKETPEEEKKEDKDKQNTKEASLRSQGNILARLRRLQA